MYRIEGYELVNEIGRGGMGVVYRAQQLSLQRWVAIKILTTTDKEAITAARRMHREAEAMKALHHPNVVRLLDHGLDQDPPFLVLEYIEESRSLLSLLVLDPPGPERAMSLAREVAGGLAHIHEHSLVHRDLKPANVLVDGDGHAKIIDLGAVRDLASNQTRLTQDGMVLGTLSYMAPEQLEGLPVTPAADVYAFGLLLFELLARELIFSSAARDPVALTDRLQGELPDVRRWWPGAPEAVVSLLRACLAVNPRERPADGAALVEAFERIEQGPVAQATGTIPTPLVKAPVKDPPRSGPAGRTVLTAASVVALGLGLVVFSLRGPRAIPAGAASTAPVIASRSPGPDLRLLRERMGRRPMDRDLLKSWLTRAAGTRTATSFESLLERAGAKGLHDALVADPLPDLPRSEWATFADLEILEHVALVRGWTGAGRLLERVERMWPSVDPLNPIDDSWHSAFQICSERTGDPSTRTMKSGSRDALVDPPSERDSDVYLLFGPARFTFVIARPAASARLWISTTRLQPGTLVDLELNGHRLILRAGASASPGPLPTLLEDHLSLRGSLLPLLHQGRREVILRGEEPLSSLQFRCLGREIPATWLKAGINAMELSRWDIPEARTGGKGIPAIWAKVVSVQPASPPR